MEVTEQELKEKEDNMTEWNNMQNRSHEGKLRGVIWQKEFQGRVRLVDFVAF